MVFRPVSNDLWHAVQIEVLMMDDGGSDGTVERAHASGANLPLSVLSHGINRGPGRAFATAFNNLAPQVQEDDWVITMEGDNTSRHELIAQMFRRSEEGYDVILANP